MTEGMSDRQRRARLAGFCAKCGKRKTVRPPNCLPDCPDCDTLTKAEAERILNMPTEQGGE